MAMKPKMAGESFDAWYFEDGYFCSPEGDRFSPWMIRACTFYRQAREVSNLLHWRPQEPTRDVVMVELMDLLDYQEAQQQAIAAARKEAPRAGDLSPARRNDARASSVAAAWLTQEPLLAHCLSE